MYLYTKFMHKQHILHDTYNIDELISSFRWPEHEVDTKSALDLHSSHTSTADSR